jgi:hypothetical protein
VDIGTIIFAALVVSFPVVVTILIQIIRERNRLFAEEVFDRWIMPEVERARAAGINEDEIDRIVKRAIKDSDPTMGRYPAAVLRGLVDEAIAITRE